MKVDDLLWITEIADGVGDDHRSGRAWHQCIAEREKLLAFVRGSRREHAKGYNDGGGCEVWNGGSNCHCGADEFNARVDAIVKECES